VYGLGCFAFRRAKAKHCECRPYQKGDKDKEKEEEGGEGGKKSKTERINDIRGSLVAVMERAARADTPVAGASHCKWEEFL